MAALLWRGMGQTIRTRRQLFHGTILQDYRLSVSGQVKDLFSLPTYQAFEKMELHIMTAPRFSTQELMDRVPRITEFNEVGEIAMQALYKEIGILPCSPPPKGETIWSQLKQWFKSLWSGVFHTLTRFRRGS
jgi:hypothetical protein